MRFKLNRQLGRFSLSAAVLVALSSGPATAQDARPVPDSPQAGEVVIEVGQAPQDPPDFVEDTAVATDRSPAQIGLSPVDRPEADLQPTPADTPGVTELVPKKEQPSAAVPPAARDAVTIPAHEKPLKPIPDPLESGPVEIEAASFKGVTPGVTSMEQVEKAWGAPKEISKQGKTLIQLYAVEPFDRVEVSYFNDKVSSIVIRFDRAFPAGAVAQQLELTNVRPVLISNELGDILGQVYPERGVLFSFEPSEEPGKASMKVPQIILEPISAEPFVLRAETNLDSHYESSRQDLQQALKLQPGNARAHWLYSRVLVAMGEFDKAAAASSQAVRLEPGNSRYRVARAQILGQVGQLNQAIREAQKAVEISPRRPHVKARALCLIGDLVASGVKPDYRRAIQYHMQAVKVADPLVTDRHPAIRLAAKEVLINAHLGAAHDIAWGNWKEKQKAVTRWLVRAEALAEELIENEGGSREHRFRVSTRALAAYVGMRGELNPSRWTKVAVRTGEELIASTGDPLRKARFQWDLGMALYDALQIYQMLDDHDLALKYGEWAIEYLEKGDRQKQSATTGYLLGRLYFRLGAIHAIRDQNHRVAITWFDKAVPLLKKPIPKEAFADLGRHGETFVSMGVSYWKSEQREKAVELTEIGVGLMEQAVKQGSLDETALAIPYSNLASMHRRLGRNDKADRFERMADKVKRTRVR